MEMLNKTINKKKMKKLILIAAVAFTACGSPKTQETNCDSTCVDSTHVDTTKVIDTLVIDTIKK
jgi:hypothetical protein